MASIESIALTNSERATLQNGSRNGATFGYRQRCQMILLKSENRTSKEVAEEIGCREVVINSVKQGFTCTG